LAALERRYNDLAVTSEKLLVASDETQQQIQDQSAQMNVELQKNLDTQQQMLSEMFLVFDAQLEKLTSELNQKVDSLAARTGEDHQALADDLARRIQELAATTRAYNDRVASVMEARLAAGTLKSSLMALQISPTGLWRSAASSPTDKIGAARFSTGWPACPGVDKSLHGRRTIAIDCDAPPR
jgi:septal ring factor EnvC (AmiA/AmiB activator)